MKTLPIVLVAFALGACNADGPRETAADAPAAPTAPSTAPPPASDTLPDPMPAPDAPPPATGEARFDGYGAMRFGMTEADAREAASAELVELGPGAGTDSCHYLNPAGVSPPSYLAFMFDGGRFVRYDVGNDVQVAPGGGKRGMTADAIRALYPGGVQASPHKYVDGGQYLRIKAPEGDGVLVFETDPDGKVTEWHAGLPPQVDYIEGCS